MSVKMLQGGGERRGWCRLGFWGIVGTIAVEALQMYMGSRKKSQEQGRLEADPGHRCREIEAPEPQDSSIKFLIDSALCTGCGTCLTSCRSGAIILEGGRALLDAEKCTGCQACYEACPEGAVIKQVRKC
ncbi:MAG: 4Fe-4S binding protein [Candidatus Eremiobacteraeota bacterium]|nr:4Fe-4S binding protein [Candidatus Eremiobacteraeota bacterium]